MSQRLLRHPGRLRRRRGERRLEAGPHDTCERAGRDERRVVARQGRRGSARAGGRARRGDCRPPGRVDLRGARRLAARAAHDAASARRPGPRSGVERAQARRCPQPSGVAEFAVELAGEAGWVEGPLTREFLNTRCLSIAGGTTQILLTVAAEQLLGLPRG
ncbi:hypothetical protein GS462_25760 [Rhodococcus hoagii]|nr:hypothetical protein [Prescottella equi]